MPFALRRELGCLCKIPFHQCIHNQVPSCLYCGHEHKVMQPQAVSLDFNLWFKAFLVAGCDWLWYLKWPLKVAMWTDKFSRMWPGKRLIDLYQKKKKGRLAQSLTYSLQSLCSQVERSLQCLLIYFLIGIKMLFSMNDHKWFVLSNYYLRPLASDKMEMFLYFVNKSQQTHEEMRESERALYAAL